MPEQYDYPGLVKDLDKYFLQTFFLSPTHSINVLVEKSDRINNVILLNLNQVSCLDCNFCLQYFTVSHLKKYFSVHCEHSVLQTCENIHIVKQGQEEEYERALLEQHKKNVHNQTPNEVV
jgi:hypothetical protein